MSRKKNNEVFDKENLIEYTDFDTYDGSETVIDTTETLTDSIKNPVVEDTIKSCKVIKAIANDKAIIDFDGFGIIVPVDNAHSLSGKHIDIKYSGNIGKADFRYEVV